MRMLRTAAAGLIVALLALSACGAEPQEPDATQDKAAFDVLVATTVSLTVESIAAEMVALLAEEQLTMAAPTAGLPAPEPTTEVAVVVVTASAVEEDTPAAPTGTPPPTVPPSCSVVAGVRMRSGPGTSYDPPLGALTAGTELVPLAYVPIGEPQGPWLQVEVVSTGQVAWLTASPQYVTCNIDVATLSSEPAPAATARPPADATETPVPAQTATAPDSGGNSAPAPTPAPAVQAGPPPIVTYSDTPGEYPADHVQATVVFDPAWLMRMDIQDNNAPSGDGIRFIEFFVIGDDEEFYHKEDTAAYCIFGGGDPACANWPVDAQGRYTWGEGGVPVMTGEYRVQIRAAAEIPDADFGDQWVWNFTIFVDLP